MNQKLKNDVLDNLNFELKYGSMKNRYFKKSNSYEDEIELRTESKVRIDEINKLKEDVRNNEAILLNNETEIDHLLTNLKYEEKDIMNAIMKSEEKLRKLRMSSSYIIEIQKFNFISLKYIFMKILKSYKHHNHQFYAVYSKFF